MYENEIWKDVVGHEGLYQVSDWGRVRSLDRPIERKSKRLRNKKANFIPGRIMKQDLSHKGYLAVVFQRNGKRERKEVHTLVACAFYGPLPPKHHTHHRNDNKLDNRLTNLVYLTATMHVHITHRGTNAHKARLNEDQVGEIRDLLAQGYTQKVIAKRYGVARSTIGEINRGASWEWLPT